MNRKVGQFKQFLEGLGLPKHIHWLECDQILAAARWDDSNKVANIRYEKKFESNFWVNNF